MNMDWNIDIRQEVEPIDYAIIIVIALAVGVGIGLVSTKPWNIYGVKLWLGW